MRCPSREKMLRLLDGAGEKLRLRREVDGCVRQAHDEAEARRILALGLEHFWSWRPGIGAPAQRRRSQAGDRASDPNPDGDAECMGCQRIDHGAREPPQPCDFRQGS